VDLNNLEILQEFNLADEGDLDFLRN